MSASGACFLSIIWNTVSLSARERRVRGGGEVGGTLMSPENVELVGDKAKEGSAGISGRPLKGVEVSRGGPSGISMAVSSIGVLNPCGISIPGLRSNKFEESASPNTSIAEGRATRARRSANEIGDGSEVEAEASGLMAL